jgi:hypothetical protein
MLLTKDESKKKKSAFSFSTKNTKNMSSNAPAIPMETPSIASVSDTQKSTLQEHIAVSKAHWTTALFGPPPTGVPLDDATSAKTKLGMKIRGEFGAVRAPNQRLQQRARLEQEQAALGREDMVKETESGGPKSAIQRMIEDTYLVFGFI